MAIRIQCRAGILSLGLLLCLGLLPSSLQSTCRTAPSSAASTCGYPNALSNFQGYFQCETPVMVGKPENISELLTMLSSFRHVKAAGSGHSWSKEQSCSGADSNSLNIVMTELKDTVAVILNPTYPNPVPATFPIQVDENARTVTVAAGIPQRILLDYLANYKTSNASEGWTLPAFSWFIDQTIGGAVATGTHGSSMKHGSLSSQIIGLQVAIANGTLINVTPTSHPHLWRALQVSIGRLGIVTRLTFGIVSQQAVRRDETDITLDDLAAQVKKVQDEYNAAVAAKDPQAIQAALNSVDETQCFWFVQNGAVWRVDYTRLEKEPDSVLLNLSNDPAVTASDGPDPPGVYKQQLVPPVSPNTGILSNPRYWTNMYTTLGRSYVTPGVYEARNSYLSVTDIGSRTTASLNPYDQFEVAIPIGIAGDCLSQAAEFIRNNSLGDGFRVPALIRFVAQETAYLSPTNGGPRMYINLEDHLSRSSGTDNLQFQALLGFFHSKCQARLHWGKAGWPRYQPCFDGASEFKSSWCHFGCAVWELDPMGKFASQSNAWRWRATRNGTEVNFSSCCTSEGFSANCACASRQTCT